MATPNFPGVSSISVDHNGAVEILRGIAWSMPIIALTPVNVVDLPHAYLVGAIGRVVVHKVSVA